MPNRSDKDALATLLESAGRGSRSDFAQFYSQTANLTFGVLVRMLRDRDLAEDLVQEVYVKVWKRAASYDRSIAAPTTWLVTLARHTAIDKLRQIKVRPTHEEIDEIHLGHEDSTEVVATRGDTKRIIDTCLQEIDPKKGWAVRMAYIEGYSYAELSTALGQPENTLKSWLRRSLLKLRECVERYL